MTTFARLVCGLVVGMSLSLMLVGPVSAQEVPTGAARLIEKVQTRIFISQANLGFHIAAILENQPSPGGR